MTRQSRLRMVFFGVAIVLGAMLLSIPVASAQAPVANSAIVPVSKPDAGWQGRFKQFNERVKQGNVDLIFIGDSITHGWEGEGKEVWRNWGRGCWVVGRLVGGLPTPMDCYVGSHPMCGHQPCFEAPFLSPPWWKAVCRLAFAWSPHACPVGASHCDA